MPAPQANAMAQAAKNIFRGKSVALPRDWQSPGKQFADAFSIEEKQVPANSARNLFREPTLNQYHVDAARTIGTKFAHYLEGIAAAICGAVGRWMRMTFIAGVTINGSLGRMQPGAVVGPSLAPMIMAAAPRRTNMEVRYSMAIAGAVDQAWKSWQSGLNGILLYPAFDAIAGPLAPPTPNVPIPLMALSSRGESALSPPSLKDQMLTLLAEPGALHAGDLFEAVARALHSDFQSFKSSTLVTNVLGSGPVPSFSPPLAPVGPVVAGSVIPRPGVFV